MADLTPEVLPSVWSLIRRSLVTDPELNRADLIERLTPRGLIARQEAGQTTDESRHVRPSISALVDMGVVAENDAGTLRLEIGASSESEFRRVVTQRVFTIPAADETEVWRMRSELQPEHHAEIGLAWLHLQGIANPITSFPAAEQRLQRQFGPSRTLLRDTAPFNALERLSRWCGVAAHVAGEGGAGVIPDPTEAIRAELDDVIDVGAELAARAVVDRISEIFDWLPNGVTGRAVAGRMTDMPDKAPTQGTVPEGLSLALIQLHHEGLLELIAGDDASDRVTLAPGGLVDNSGAEVAAIGRIRRLAVSS